MQLLTVQREGRPTRHYIDGKRVSRPDFDTAKFWRTLDTFQTLRRRGAWFHYSQAR